MLTFHGAGSFPRPLVERHSHLIWAIGFRILRYKSVAALHFGWDAMIPRSAETHSVRLSQPERCVSLASTLNEGPSNEHCGQNERRLRPENLAGDLPVGEGQVGVKPSATREGRTGKTPR